LKLNLFFRRDKNKNCYYLPNQNTLLLTKLIISMKEGMNNKFGFRLAQKHIKRLSEAEAIQK